MTAQEIHEKVYKIVSDVTGMDISEITNETNITGNIEDIVMKFEEEFDIIIPEEEQTFETVGQTISYIDSVLNG